MNNYLKTDDYLWAVVFATKAGQLTLTAGSNEGRFAVTPGVNKVKIGSAPGRIRGVLRRGGAVIVDVSPGTDFTFTTKPRTFNFNVFSASG